MTTCAQHTTNGLTQSVIANNFAGLPSDGTSGDLLADAAARPAAAGDDRIHAASSPVNPAGNVQKPKCKKKAKKRSAEIAKKKCKKKKKK